MSLLGEVLLCSLGSLRFQPTQDAETRISGAHSAPSSLFFLYLSTVSVTGAASTAFAVQTIAGSGSTVTNVVTAPGGSQRATDVTLTFIATASGTVLPSELLLDLLQEVPD